MSWAAELLEFLDLKDRWIDFNKMWQDIMKLYRMSYSNFEVIQWLGKNLMAKNASGNWTLIAATDTEGILQEDAILQNIRI